MVLMEKDLILFEPCPFDELILKFLLCKIAPHYVEEFFLSYQNVASPGFLLEKLTNIYYSNAIHIPLDWMNKNLLDKTLEDHKIKVIRFINLWLEYGSFEIGEERKVFKRINLFITDATSNISKENFLFDYLTDCGNKIKLKILQKLHNEPDWALKIQGRSRLTDRSESYDVSNSFMSDFKEEDIVQQLAIISYDVMVRITPSEFLKVRWSKSNKLSTAPNIVNCINRFNIMSGWYAHMILKQQVPEKRAQLIMLLIRLAELCEKLKNYNSLMELLSGLHFGCISRLKRTWRLIPQKTLDLFNQLSKMMTPLRNYQYYRKLMNNIQKDDPYVPFLGVFLADFTFMEEANPDHDEEGNVNMEKICMMGNHIRTFRRFSQRPYPFNPNHLLQQSLFIQRQPLDEAELYRISTLLEKPDQTLDNSKYQQIDEKSITTQQRMSLGRVFQQNYSLMTSQRFTSVLNYEGATDDNISFRDWQVLLTCSRLVTCRKGQVIFPQGRINDAIYYIHAGRVDLEYSSPSGEKQHLATLASTDVLCDVLGMMSDHMFMAQPWVEINSREGFSDFRFGHNSESGAESAVSAIAGSHGTQLMEIQADFLYRIFLSEPELAEKFFKQCVRYLAHLVRNQNDQRKHKNLRSVLGPETDEKEDTENSYDSTFRKDFSIKECREVVIKEYRCTRQPKNLKSKLYISQNYLCLSSRVFKIRKKLVIPLKDLHVVNASDSDLTFSSTTKKKVSTQKETTEHSYNFI
eukprot:TRINITY_DN2685_c0_g1_i3.p1 TRINITY_DN2685_c0_g1~~TRINITY_DN2685_c0_g1_i3.p1  ORF type:complete len:747 (-),score=137.26 TRINITY_DN2685_c0_g1_i3:22-2262(-)